MYAEAPKGDSTRPFDLENNYQFENVSIYKSLENRVMKEEKSSQEGKSMSGEKYACPMHCEEDKVYDKPGKCPICGMNLQKIQK